MTLHYLKINSDKLRMSIIKPRATTNKRANNNKKHTQRGIISKPIMEVKLNPKKYSGNKKGTKNKEEEGAEKTNSKI